MAGAGPCAAAPRVPLVLTPACPRPQAGAALLHCPGAAPNSFPGGAEAPLALLRLRNYEHPRTRSGFWGPGSRPSRADFASGQNGATPASSRLRVARRMAAPECTPPPKNRKNWNSGGYLIDSWRDRFPVCPWYRGQSFQFSSACAGVATPAPPWGDPSAAGAGDGVRVRCGFWPGGGMQARKATERPGVRAGRRRRRGRGLPLRCGPRRRPCAGWRRPRRRG